MENGRGSREFGMGQRMQQTMASGGCRPNPLQESGGTSQRRADEGYQETVGGDEIAAGSGASATAGGGQQRRTVGVGSKGWIDGGLLLFLSAALSVSLEERRKGKRLPVDSGPLLEIFMVDFSGRRRQNGEPAKPGQNREPPENQELTARKTKPTCQLGDSLHVTLGINPSRASLATIILLYIYESGTKPLESTTHGMINTEDKIILSYLNNTLQISFAVETYRATGNLVDDN